MRESLSPTPVKQTYNKQILGQQRSESIKITRLLYKTEKPIWISELGSFNSVFQPILTLNLGTTKDLVIIHYLVSEHRLISMIP